VEKKNAYRILEGKLSQNCPFGGPKGRWEDAIKMNVRY
jgi:hypothetical protein